MSLIEHLWAINLIGGSLGLAGALQLWGRRGEPRIRWLMILILAASEWTLAYALALRSPTLELKELFLKLEVLGIVLIPPSLFALACHSSGRQAWLKPRLMVLLGLVPFLSLSLALTNGSHHLMLARLWVEAGSPIPRYELGWAAIALNVVYSFILISLSVVLLLEAGLPSGPGRKGRSYLLLIGVLIPSLASLLDHLELIPLQGADPIPLGLSLSFLLLVYPLLRYRFYTKEKEAQDKVSQELDFRIRMLRLLFLCGMPLVIFFLVHHLYQGQKAASFFLLGLTFISLAGFLLIQSGGPAERLTRIYRIFTSLFLAVFGSLNVYFSGFKAEPDKLPWIFLFPLLAVYIFGARRGMVWTGSLVLAMIPALILGNREGWAQAGGLGLRGLVTFFLATLLVYLLERKREISTQEVFRHREELLEFENRFRLATEAGAVRVWEWNLAEEKVRLDPDLDRIPDPTGTSEPTEPRGWLDKIHPEDREMVRGTVQRALEEGRAFVQELRLVNEKGDSRWMEVRGSVVAGKGGRPEKMVGTTADVNDFKRTEEELRIQKEYFENLIETSPEAIAVIDRQARITRINKEFESLFGYPPGEARGRFLDELIVPRELIEEAKSLGREARRLGKAKIESIRRRRDGGRIDVSILLKAIQGEDGSPGGIYAIYRDITREKEAERAFRQSYRILVTILDSIDANVNVTDLQTRKILFMNRHMAADFGKNLEGQACYRALGEEEAPCSHCHNERLLDGQGKPTGAYSWEGMNPVTGKWYIYHDRVIDWVDGRKVKLQVAADVSELKQAQEELAESERKYRELINSISDFLFTHDLEGRFSSINIAFDDLLGYPPEELIGRPAADLIPEPTRAAFYDDYLTSIKEQGFAEGLFRVIARDGGSHYIEYRNSLVRPVRGEPYVSGVGRDVTERYLAQKRVKVLQEQLYQARKMEAIGTLAGGMAHDFNNTLMSIIGYTELARDDLDRDSASRRRLDQVLAAGQRAADLVEQILSFSREGEGERKPLRLGPVLEERLNLIRATLPGRIEVEQEISGAGLVMADPAQIQRLLMNLSSNAVLAMGQKGGNLSIILERIFLDREAARRITGLEEGPHLRLQVSDTGCGMDRRVLGRIFEPFFTTREQGQGNGMGLAVVHGIVKSHQGAIEVESKPGQGTAFTVYLPELSPDPPDRARAEAVPPPRGSERVMFVDAEPTLVLFGREILERLGYRATSFESSTQALTSFKKDSGSYDLIITGQDMPGMTGLELARRMKEVRPDIPVILCTGLERTLNEEEAGANGISRLLTKPLSMAEMAVAIREVLDER